jgi:hypothetical protein
MPLILGGSSAVAAAFSVDNSCRFNTPDSPNLTRACGTPTDNLKYTISFWFKRTLLSDDMYIMSAKTDGNNYFQLRIKNDDNMYIWDVHSGGSPSYQLTTDRKFRDVTAWYHLVYVYDSANGVAGNRMRLYINGTEETSFSSDVNPALNYASNMNLSGTDIDFGDLGGGDYYGGYLAEAVLIDGQALTPTSFGEFDSDSPTIWKPIDVSGLTFGNNGYYLDFKDSANLGNDANGGTDFTETNIVAADQAQDSPTNNFATLNSLNIPSSSPPTFSNGNNTVVTMNAASKYFGGTTTQGLSSGKWYWETYSVSALAAAVVGVYTAPNDAAVNGRQVGYSTYDWAYEYDGTILSNNIDQDTGMGSWTTGDYMGTYLDLDNNKIYWAENGVIINSGVGWDITASSSIPSGFYFPGCSDQETTSSTFAFNFGNGRFGDIIPAGTVYADADGYGIFKYSPNDGGSASFDGSAKDFMAICTKNLGAYGG